MQSLHLKHTLVLLHLSDPLCVNISSLQLMALRPLPVSSVLFLVLQLRRLLHASRPSSTVLYPPGRFVLCLFIFMRTTLVGLD